MLSSASLQSLEFDAVIRQLEALCASAPGQARARSLRPLSTAEEAEEAAGLYSEAAVWAESPGQRFSLTAFPDISGLLAQAGEARFLPDAEAFWALRNVLALAAEAREAIDTGQAQALWPRLLALANAKPAPLQLTAALKRCISDDCLLKDESSPELFRLRGELRRLHQSCLGKARAFADEHHILPYLQDAFLTLSQDRYVLPIKASYKASMPGILHDWSQTGETCYFEPMFLVELNNRAQELRRQERLEEQNVLKYLADLLQRELEGVRAAWELLTILDVLAAKRRLAQRLGGRMLPFTPASEGLRLLAARHPLLALERPRSSREPAAGAARPLDIELRPGEHGLVVTGGNAGGKTVCLKTLGLIAAMAASALPVPVDKGSRLPWFAHLEAFLGDEQSLEAKLSTFTAQIEHLARIWPVLGEDCLLLLDEFGAGTDPAQGAALAQAVLDALLERRVFVLAATHFPALKLYAMSGAGCRAASMLFDPQSHKPLYRLGYDQVGTSQALLSARAHGLPEEILQRAEKYLLRDGRDDSLERLNALAVRREEELEALRLEREKAQNAAHGEQIRLQEAREKLCLEIRGEARKLMQAWKSGRATAKQSLKEMARLRASLTRDAAPAAEGKPPRLNVGQTARHSALRRTGVITGIDERRGRVRLSLDGVNWWASLADVRPCEAAGAKKPENNSGAQTPAAEDAALRLDVRGQRGDEAREAVARFLDKALLAGFSQIEIVHGRGTGVLRREIHDFLRSFPPVARFAAAPEDQGGDGMTLVDLR